MLNRRGFLKTGVAGGLTAGLPLAGARAQAAGSFTHGVASGDPLADRVILWTRYVPADGAAAEVAWEVATDAGFASIVASGKGHATPERDFTVKVDARPLAPGGRYFYRFRDSGGQISTVGQTRTLPTGAVEALNIALFSCSNLPFGYFNAYAHAAARDDIDLALHVGDYIYEYQRGTYPPEQAVVDGRHVEPTNEIVALADYRQRYAQYRRDPDLQAVHQRLPFLCVWDDHELANNTWKGGAQNHQPDSEGPWDRRWRAAYQAYCEWLPIREQAPGLIYRRFDWGRLASLIMLDTRFIGRDEQFDYKELLGSVDKNDPAAVTQALRQFGQTVLDDPRRSILGHAQERWLARQMADSRARGVPWQVLGQQVLAGWSRMPPELPSILGPQTPSYVREYVSAGAIAGGLGLPANLDAWAGYPAARRRLVDDILKYADNAVILAGDTHNAWAFELLGGPDGRPAAVEFGTHSVTSPGMESAFENTSGLAALLVAANPELKWVDTHHRGYCTVRFTPESATAEFVLLKTIKERSTQLDGLVRAEVKAVKGPGVSPLTFG
ncbi:alkaline phosphatase D family protein [Parapedomonas caeni]